MEYNNIQYTISETNCHIVDSYLVTDENVMRDFCEHVLPENFLQRSIISYLREGKAHNGMFKHNIIISRTKDVDLNVDECLYKRLGYWLISLFC